MFLYALAYDIHMEILYPLEDPKCSYLLFVTPPPICQ